MPSTITSQLNWVCADRWKPIVIKMSFWLSAAVGAVIWMNIGNRYSKCFSLLLSLGMCLFGSILIMISTTFPSLLIAWIIMGSCQMAVMCLPISIVKDLSSSTIGCTLHQMIVPLLVWHLSQSACLLLFLGVSATLTSWWWLAAFLPPFSTICLLVCVWSTWKMYWNCSRMLPSSLESPLKESVDEAVLYDVHLDRVTFQMGSCSLEYLPETDCKWKNNIPFALHWLLSSWCYWMLVHTSPWLGTSADTGEPSLSLTLNLYLAELPTCCYPLLKLLLPNSVVICRQSLLSMTLLLVLAPATTAATSISNWVLYEKAPIQEVCLAAVGHFGAMSALSVARLLGLSRTLQSCQSVLIWEAVGGFLAAVVELISGQRDTKLLFLLAGIVATVAALYASFLPEYICCSTKVTKTMLPPIWIQRCRSSIIDSPLGQIFFSDKTETHSKYDSPLSYAPLEAG